MIQRLKQITKFMAVCALLVLGSCEKDIYENQIEQNRVKTVNLNDLPMLQNAIASKRNSITLTGKSIVDYLNLIQPNGIKLAEVSDGKKFYTCALNIDEYQKLTNLLIEEKNGVYDYKLIEYTANDFDAWKAKVEQQRLFDIMPIVTIKDLEGRLFDFGFGPCVQVYGVCPSGLHLCNNSDVDPECNYLLNEWNFITVPVSCYGLPEGASPSQGNSTSSNGSSGSSSGGGGSGSGSNSGSSTNGSTNNNFNSQIITTPLVHGTLLEKKFLSFISQLNQQSQDFLNDDENSVIRSNVRAYLVQNNFSSESVIYANDITDLATAETDQYDVTSLINLSLKLENAGTNLFDDDFALSIDPYIDLDLAQLNTPPSTLSPNLVVLHTYMKYRLLRQMNPTWSKAKCMWESTKETIHISLDAFGLIPVAGEVADLTNGVLYTIEGDGVNATLSVASALPIAGWATVGTKYAVKIIDASQTATTIATKVKLTWKVIGNTIEFGNRGQLRKVLGLLPGNPLQAHHLIPWSSQSKMAVQKAAKYGSAFHMNEALNGIAVAAWRNQPNHQIYNNIIDGKLDAFRNLNPNATPQECYEFLTDLIQDVRNWVINNPNSHLNDLVLP